MKKGKKDVDPSAFNQSVTLLPYTQALPHEDDDDATMLDTVSMHAMIHASMDITQQEASRILKSRPREISNAAVGGSYNSFFDELYEHEVTVDNVFPPPNDVDDQKSFDKFEYPIYIEGPFLKIILIIGFKDCIFHWKR